MYLINWFYISFSGAFWIGIVYRFVVFGFYRLSFFVCAVFRVQGGLLVVGPFRVVWCGGGVLVGCVQSREHLAFRGLSCR